MPDVAEPSPPTSSSGASPSRPWLSLLLAIHCVCVAGALWGSYEPSVLLQRFLTVVSPYTSATHMDPAPATFFSTHGLLEDMGHQIQLLETIDGQPQWTPLATPGRGTLDRLRHLRLARLAGFWVEIESDESLAAVIRDAADWARRAGRTPSAIRIRRQQLQSPEDLRDAVPSDAGESRLNPTHPSYFETIYTADVIVADDQLSIVKRAPDQENARVAP